MASICSVTMKLKDQLEVKDLRSIKRSETVPAVKRTGNQTTTEGLSSSVNGCVLTSTMSTQPR